MEINNRTLEISNPGKTLFPEPGLTKADLARYYARISHVMLGHLKDRPVSMERFPDGVEGESFFQKEVPDYFPDWLARRRMKRKSGGTIPYLLCNKPEDLVYLADQGCITPHIWLSRVDSPDFPDRMIFDLDPPGSDFLQVRRAALRLCRFLDGRHMPSYLMTTGSRGIHVVVPLRRTRRFDPVRQTAQEIANALAERYPDSLTVEMRRDKRDGRVYLDTARNAYGQTAVAPYAVRATARATMATPVTREELARGKIDSRTYHVRNIFRRLGQRKDPWRDMASHAIVLE